MAYLTFAYHPATDRTRHRTASAWSPGVADGPGDYGESVTLTVSAQVALILAGLIFLWALLLGIWKFQQIARSPQGQAHVYVDIAHRAALLYAFATGLLAAFVQFSAWPTWLNVGALSGVVFFFVAAIGSYCLHGWKQDTENQLKPLHPPVMGFMIALIVGEVGGSALILAGFIVEQAKSWG